MNSNLKINEKKIFLSILFAIYTFFLIINFIAPLMGEDLILVAFSKNYEVLGIRDFLFKMIHRVYNQMTGWNIRIGEQFSIIFSCFNKILFDILNSLVALVYIWLVLQYAFKTRVTLTKINALKVLIIFTLIISAQPVMGEIFFWRTGSTNYLWAICLLLFFGLPIRYYIGYESRDIIGNSRIKAVLLSILGFFAGFTNENTIAVFIVLYVGVCIYNYKKKRKTPIWIYASGTTLTLGFICMYEAPSTKIRVQTYKQIFGIEQVSLQDYFTRAQNIIQRFFSDNKILVIITVVLIVSDTILVMIRNREQLSEKKRIVLRRSENLGLLCVSAISCGALIMSPYVETRAFLLPDFLMMACIVYYIELIVESIRKKRREFKYSLAIAMLLICTCQGITIFNVYNEYNQYVTLRDSAIELDGENSTFIWGEYQKPYSSRILTTREDYLMSNETGLNNFYSHSIRCWNNYVWNMNLSNYTEQEAIANIDAVSYDQFTDSLSVYGWSTLLDENAGDIDNYVYIEADGNRYYFKTQKNERKDVVNVCENEKYLNSGFQVQISSIKEFLGNDLDEITVGICTINYDKKEMNNELTKKCVSLLEE